MATYKLVVMVNAAPGKDEEFNRWYDEQHLADVLAIPGLVSAQRFHRVAGSEQWGYLTLYELETVDPQAILAALGERAGTSAMIMSDALDSKDAFVTIFEPSAN